MVYSLGGLFLFYIFSLEAVNPFKEQKNFLSDKHFSSIKNIRHEIP